VSRTFKLVQDGLSLITYAGLLLQFSVWTVAVLILAAVPAFVAETRFAGKPSAYAGAPETRRQNYETLIARETMPRRFSSTN